MNRIYYTIQDRQQLPADVDWLTPDEQARYESFRFEKRRSDWLLGRWAAKIALLGAAGMPRQDIVRFEVATASDGAPQPKLDARPHPVTLSLSHSHDRALAAVAPGTTELGCDIELIETRSAGFVDTYFTAAEQEAVTRADPAGRDAMITLIWSAKESMLKALRTGLRADTRSVEVAAADMGGKGWRSAQVVAEGNGSFGCRWRCDDRFIITLATRDLIPESMLLEV